MGCSYMQEYRSGHNEAVLKTVCPKGTGVRIPLPAPKNKDTPLGCPLFFGTVRGDEPEGFAYRRHRVHHEEQSIRGICVARRCRLKFIPKRNGFYKPHPEQHTPLPLPQSEALERPSATLRVAEWGSHLSRRARSEAAREC